MKFIYNLLYLLFGLMVMLPANFDINDWRFWVMIIGATGLYGVGRCEALYEKNI